jgi:hypothetical protein
MLDQQAMFFLPSFLVRGPVAQVHGGVSISFSFPDCCCDCVFLFKGGPCFVEFRFATKVQLRVGGECVHPSIQDHRTTEKGGSLQRKSQPYDKPRASMVQQ